MPHRVPPVDPVDPVDPVAHDADLVAAYAAGDATGAELEAATTLVAACAGCAALHRDLRTIAAALPATPAPRRARDFRLTPEQAASLRPAGWRRVLAPFGGTRFAFAAPLGSGLAALGIVGILLAGPGLSMGGATAGAGSEAERTTTNVPQMAPAPGAAATDDVFAAQDASAAPDMSPAADESEDPQVALQPADQPAAGTSPGDTVAKSDGGSTVPVALVVSLAALALGVVLVALRLAGRSAARAP